MIICFIARLGTHECNETRFRQKMQYFIQNAIGWNFISHWMVKPVGKLLSNAAVRKNISRRVELIFGWY